MQLKAFFLVVPVPEKNFPFLGPKTGQVQAL
jgi:hypothetical protein